MYSQSVVVTFGYLFMKKLIRKIRIEGPNVDLSEIFESLKMTGFYLLVKHIKLFLDILSYDLIEVEESFNYLKLPSQSVYY